MTIERILELILGNLGVLVTLALFSYLWLTGRIISAGELRRTVESYAREISRLEKERDHERQEKVEWKLMAHRGTDLAKFFGEKATS